MPLLLTDELIDLIHRFRVGIMADGLLPSWDGLALGGGYMRYAGDGSPLTQAYGVGHRGAAVDFEAVDGFFEGRASNWELIVTPFADPGLLRRAADFGYRPDHFETVLGQLARPQETSVSADIRIEEAHGDLDLWMRVGDAAWGELDELPEAPSELGRIMGSTGLTARYIAYWRDEPAATASMVSWHGSHLFAGAATRPQFRGRGLQAALLQRRFRDAGDGSFVQMVALPGSSSHRNAQRVGFQPLYSKLVCFRR